MLVIVFKREEKVTAVLQKQFAIRHISLTFINGHVILFK